MEGDPNEKHSEISPKLYEGFQLYRGGVRGDSIWITM